MRALHEKSAPLRFAYTIQASEDVDDLFEGLQAAVNGSFMTAVEGGYGYVRGVPALEYLLVMEE